MLATGLLFPNGLSVEMAPPSARELTLVVSMWERTGAALSLFKVGRATVSIDLGLSAGWGWAGNTVNPGLTKEIVFKVWVWNVSGFKFKVIVTGSDNKAIKASCA
jgi:hypothetical protein